MRALVTGGAGFIGSHLVEALLREGAEVFVLDDFNDFYSPETKRENLAAVAHQIELIEGDICDKRLVDELLAGTGFDVVFHLAARAGVRPSIQQPQLYLDVNIQGTFNLLQAAREAGLPRFIFASSSSVYGLNTEVPFREDHCISQTISPYAASKLASEQLCSTYAHLYGMQIVCLRFFTVYGPRQRPDLAIHRFTHRIANGSPIDKFGDGSTRRDYTYIDDIIQGVLAARDYHGPCFDIFNLGESETTTLSELIAAIEEAVGQKAEVRTLPEQPGDVPLTCADISKAKRLLGYHPQTPIREGIPRFVQWYRRYEQAAVNA